jgi:hypothetical protein
MMTQSNETAENKGEVRPSPGRNEKLEDKIADEKDEQIGDHSVSHELKKDW